jgi:hypothetical protein
MTATAGYEVKGTTDDVTTCERCGREDLKSTVVLQDADGATAYLGTDCAAHVAGRTQQDIRDSAYRAGRYHAAAQQAAADAHRRATGGVYTVTFGASARRGLSAQGIHNQAAAIKRHAYSKPITVTLDGVDVTDQFPEFAAR